jgi:hypothetical protein
LIVKKQNILLVKGDLSNLINMDYTIGSILKIFLFIAPVVYVFLLYAEIDPFYSVSIASWISASMIFYFGLDRAFAFIPSDGFIGEIRHSIFIIISFISGGYIVFKAMPDLIKIIKNKNKPKKPEA